MTEIKPLFIAIALSLSLAASEGHAQQQSVEFERTVVRATKFTAERICNEYMNRWGTQWQSMRLYVNDWKQSHPGTYGPDRIACSVQKKGVGKWRSWMQRIITYTPN